MGLAKSLAVGTGALAAGLIAAFVAWKHVRPVYTSEALVRIAWVIPQVVMVNDQNAPLPMFDQFMQSQSTLITSRRVIDRAMQDPVWKAYKLQVPSEPDAYFAQHLGVVVMPNSELIRIAVNDPDPSLAAAAVTAIVNSYAMLYDEQEAAVNRSRMNQLDEKLDAAKKQIGELMNVRRAASAQFGSTNLQPFYDAAVARAASLEQRLSEERMAQSLASAGASTTDPVMRTYVEQRDQRSDEYKKLRGQFSEDNPQVKAAKDLLADAESRVDAYSKGYSARMDVLAGELKEARAAVAVVGAKMDEVQLLEKNLAGLQSVADDTGKRLELLRSEASLGGRLRIISTGEVAASPSRDSRLSAASVAGGVGFLAPLALFGAVRTLRKWRHRGAAS